MSIDLSGLTLSELEQLVKDATARVSTIRASRITDVRREIEKLARERGFAISELFPAAKGKVASNASKPKYSNPNNPMQFWTGRGKRPQWLSEAVAGGAAIESFLIR